MNQPGKRIVVVGVSGSGKSTAARTVAPEIGAVPGAVVLRSDVERKRMLGVSELTRLGEEAYRPEVSNLIYATLRKRAATALSVGHSVVVDAVHLKGVEREMLSKVAKDARVPFVGIWLTAPPDVLVARIQQRQGDASDATAQQIDDQLKAGSGTVDWAMIDSSRSIEHVRADVLGTIRNITASAA